MILFCHWQIPTTIIRDKIPPGWFYVMVGMCIVIIIFVIIVGNRSKLAAFEFSIYPGSPIPIGAVHSNSTRVGFCQYLRWWSDDSRLWARATWDMEFNLLSCCINFVYMRNDWLSLIIIIEDVTIIIITIKTIIHNLASSHCWLTFYLLLRTETPI